MIDYLLVFIAGAFAGRLIDALLKSTLKTYVETRRRDLAKRAIGLENAHLLDAQGRLIPDVYHPGEKIIRTRDTLLPASSQRWSTSPDWKEAGYSWPETEKGDSDRKLREFGPLPGLSSSEVAQKLNDQPAKGHLIRAYEIDKRLLAPQAFSGIPSIWAELERKESDDK